MSVNIGDVDNSTTTVAKMHVAVQQAWVALRPVRIRTLVRSMLSLLQVMVTPTIDQPSMIPLVPSTNLQNFRKLRELRKLFIVTRHSSTPDTPAYCLHLSVNYSHRRCYSRISDFWC